MSKLTSFLTASALLLAIFFGSILPAAAPLPAFAQEPPPIPNIGVEPPTINEDGTVTFGDENVIIPPSEDSTGSQGGAHVGDADICGIFSGFTVFMACGAYQLLQLSGLVLWTGGIVLDKAIEIGVLEMGKVVQSIATINAAWATVRDIGNIALIAILVYISIATILRLEGYGAKQLLAKVIIVALLMNFSLFFAKFTVDVANLFAIEIYNSGLASAVNNAKISPSGGAEESFGDTEDTRIDGVAAIFMNSMRLQSLYVTSLPSGDELQERATSIIWGSLFGAVLFLVAGILFFFAAILLIIRLVVLILVMVLSPIGFVGTILPKTQSYSARWWNTLFSQAFFAPVYLLLVFLSLSIMSSLNWDAFVPGNVSFGAIIQGQVAAGAIAVINFIIVVIFMVSSIIIAKQLGAYGAASMVKWGGGFASKWGGRALFGTPAFLLRGTFGWAGDKISQSRGMRNLASSDSVLGGLARGVIGASRWTGRRGFDARNSGLIGGALGQGTQEGGLTDRRDKAAQKKQEFGQFLGSKTRGEEMEKIRARKRGEEIDEEMEENRKDLDRENDKDLRRTPEGQNYAEGLRRIEEANERIAKAVQEGNKDEEVRAKDELAMASTQVEVSKRQLREQGVLKRIEEREMRYAQRQDKLRKETAEITAKVGIPGVMTGTIDARAEKRLKDYTDSLMSGLGALGFGASQAAIELDKWFANRDRRQAAEEILAAMKRSGVNLPGTPASKAAPTPQTPSSPEPQTPSSDKK